MIKLVGIVSALIFALDALPAARAQGMQLTGRRDRVERE
jgi:hypothetical protein